jgi:hypothetical protein
MSGGDDDDAEILCCREAPVRYTDVAKVKRTLRENIKKLTKTAEFFGVVETSGRSRPGRPVLGFIWTLRVFCEFIRSVLAEGKDTISVDPII